MDSEIKVRDDLELWCSNCGYKKSDTVQINLSQHPKRSLGVRIELNTFLCTECFIKIFDYKNWLKHWRTEVKEQIQKPKRSWDK